MLTIANLSNVGSNKLTTVEPHELHSINGGLAYSQDALTRDPAPVAQPPFDNNGFMGKLPYSNPLSKLSGPQSTGPFPGTSWSPSLYNLS